MRNNCKFLVSVARIGTFSLALLLSSTLAAQSQTRPASSAKAVPTPAASATSADEQNLQATREELFRLLRMSPKLTTVISHDPSLLGDQEYVSRNNPELARFLQEHPAIARNPEFYLFANVGLVRNRPPELAIQQQVWPGLADGGSSMTRQIVDFMGPFLVFLCILGALLWLLRVVVENRRWNRIFKLQTDVHTRMLDKFATSGELLTYMGTDAGKRFLEAAPISVGLERRSLVGTPVARMLLPLQGGVVLASVGIGFLLLRGHVPDAAVPFLVLGILSLMLGIGFIISAGISWALARHLGLLPQGPTAKPENEIGLGARGQM